MGCGANHAAAMHVLWKRALLVAVFMGIRLIVMDDGGQHLCTAFNPVALVRAEGRADNMSFMSMGRQW